jgi:hypothetical protein
MQIEKRTGRLKEAMQMKRGQGSTEYLIIIAVVLLIALAVLAFFIFFPSTSVDTQIAQSDAYWRMEARPLAIVDHSFQASTGQGTLVMQNMEADMPITLYDIRVGPCNLASPVLKFSPGETRLLNITGCPTSGVSPGSTYAFNVSYSYTTDKLYMTYFSGAKSLVGKYK